MYIIFFSVGDSTDIGKSHTFSFFFTYTHFVSYLSVCLYVCRQKIYVEKNWRNKKNTHACVCFEGIRETKTSINHRIHTLTKCQLFVHKYFLTLLHTSLALAFVHTHAHKQVSSISVFFSLAASSVYACVCVWFVRTCIKMYRERNTIRIVKRMRRNVMRILFACVRIYNVIERAVVYSTMFWFVRSHFDSSRSSFSLTLRKFILSLSLFLCVVRKIGTSTVIFRI